MIFSAAMTSIGEETDRLSRLTEQLLLLAAADEQRLSLSRESVKLGDLLEEVAGVAAVELSLQGRTITVESDETTDLGGPSAARVCPGQPDGQRAHPRRG